jgi:hypothetical protein
MSAATSSASVVLPVWRGPTKQTAGASDRALSTVQESSRFIILVYLPARYPICKDELANVAISSRRQSWLVPLFYALKVEAK